LSNPHQSPTAEPRLPEKKRPRGRWPKGIVIGGLLVGLPLFIVGVAFGWNLPAHEGGGFLFAAAAGVCWGTFGFLMGGAIWNVAEAFVRDYQEHYGRVFQFWLRTGLLIMTFVAAALGIIVWAW